MIRPEATRSECDFAIKLVTEKLYKRLEEKGWGKFSSTHETYGVLAEEFNKELLDALTGNDAQEFGEELIDIAVAAIFGLVSLMPTKGGDGDMKRL